MNSEFEHPIYYVEKKQKLDDNIIEDLELLELFLIYSTFVNKIPAFPIIARPGSKIIFKA